MKAGSAEAVRVSSSCAHQPGNPQDRVTSSKNVDLAWERPSRREVRLPKVGRLRDMWSIGPMNISPTQVFRQAISALTAVSTMNPSEVSDFFTSDARSMSSSTTSTRRGGLVTGKR